MSLPESPLHSSAGPCCLAGRAPSSLSRSLATLHFLVRLTGHLGVAECSEKGGVVRRLFQGEGGTWTEVWLLSVETRGCCFRRSSLPKVAAGQQVAWLLWSWSGWTKAPLWAGVALSVAAGTYLPRGIWGRPLLLFRPGALTLFFVALYLNCVWYPCKYAYIHML